LPPAKYGLTIGAGRTGCVPPNLLQGGPTAVDQISPVIASVALQSVVMLQLSGLKIHPQQHAGKDQYGNHCRSQ
jgi:hypothetical protein